MTDEELATMLETVADELDERSAQDPLCDSGMMRQRASELRPKRVFVWTGGLKCGVCIWAWEHTGLRWGLYSRCAVDAGTIFADHEPDAALSLAELNITRVNELPPNWNCKR